MANDTNSPIEQVAKIDLAVVVARHRPNVVTEEIGVVDGYRGERTWRTRVKCDGADCGFYAEGPRYWDVVREHNAHLVEVLSTEVEPLIRADERRRTLEEAASDVDSINYDAEVYGITQRHERLRVARWLRSRITRASRAPQEKS